MKPVPFIGTLALILGLALSGCLTPQQNPVHSVSLTGGGNAQTQDWTAGITITFKTPPPEFVVASLQSAGARNATINSQLSTKNPQPSVWILPQADKLSDTHQRAIANAITVPGTIISCAP